MFDERGLVAYIITVHEPSLLLAVLIAVVVLLAKGLVDVVRGKPQLSVRRVLALLIAIALGAHVLLSLRLGYSPAAIETVRVSGR